MSKTKTITVYDQDVKYDQVNDYICLTDIAALKGEDMFYIVDWLRNANTLAFIQAWEESSNPNFNLGEFTKIRVEAGTNGFRVSASRLQDVGCVGIYSKRGKFGGTYAAVEWAIHFANWLDPRFYLSTVRAYLMMQKALYGVDAARQRFARELAAETYPLATGAALSALPPAADALFEKRVASVEADILNLALWGMTAQEWRIKFPQSDARKNMRDYATPEELKTISVLQALSQEMHENGYSSEERLDRLRAKAEELMRVFCAKTEKQDLLLLAQHKRGWGRFEF